MSVYQARYRDSTLGFYDLYDHIVAVPSAGIPPDVVIDHEIAHLNIVRGSVIGLVEELTQLAWHRLNRDPETFPPQVPVLLSPGAYLNLIMMEQLLSRLAEQVHEVAAWFCTEAFLQRATEPELLATPLAYAKDTARLWTLLSKFIQNDRVDPYATVIQLVEQAAERTLSFPSLAALFDPDIPEFDRLNAAMDSNVSPIAAFRSITKKLSTWDAETISRWLQGHEIEEQISWLDRSSFDSESCATFLRSVLADSTLNSQTFDELWGAYRGWLAIDSEFDVYSQVVVIRPKERAKRISLTMLPLLSNMLGKYQSLIIHDYFSGIRGPDMEKRMRPLPEGPYSKRLRYLLTWQDWTNGSGNIAQVSASFLRSEASKSDILPIVAASGYNFKLGDLSPSEQEGPILRDTPHLVLAIRPFLSLWRTLAWSDSPGLAGHSELLFVIRESGIDEAFGYVLIRQRLAYTPMVAVPIVIAEWERVLSCRSAPQFSSAIDLMQFQGHTEAFAGDVLPHVSAALALFENWFSFSGREEFLAELLNIMDSPFSP
jgi:hypothetical protein